MTILPQSIKDEIFLWLNPCFDFETLENTRFLQSKYVQICTQFNNYTQAIENHNIENVKYLLKYIEINISLSIHIAVYNRDLEIVRFLLSVEEQFKHKSTDYNTYNSIREASEKGYIEIVKFFLDNGFDSRETITWASIRGHVETVKFLLSGDYHLDLGNYDNAAIRLASERGYSEVVELLLKDGRANPGANNNYAIQFAARNGHVDVIRLLLRDNRVDPSFAVQIASKRGHLDVIRLLLQDDRVDIKGAIKFASKYKNSAIGRVLKEYKQKQDKDDVITHELYTIQSESENRWFLVLDTLFKRNKL